MRKLKLFTIIGTLFVIITGSLAHFVYEWTGNNFAAGLFTPVNESVWEHMKLLFFPMLIYTLAMALLFRENRLCVISSFCAGILAGTVCIPVLYYTYTAILGKNILFLDIAVFVISILLAFRLSYRLSLSCRLKPYTFLLAGLVCILFICFLVFTCRPPAMGLFTPPV